MKSNVLLLPPDMHTRKRWRRVPHLANEFWSHWRKEYLLSLQEHQRWLQPRWNFCVGDIVMVKDVNLSRNNWLLTRVATVYPSKDGQVCKAQVAIADGCLDKN